MKKSVIVPYVDLTQDEVSTLKHIEKLVQICIPEFKMGSMDISEASGNAIVLTDSNHFEIPRGLLREKIEHYGGENCRRGDSCLCREALIAAKILTLQPNLNGELFNVKFKHRNLCRGHFPSTNPLPYLLNPSCTIYYTVTVSSCISVTCTPGPNPSLVPVSTSP